MYPLLRTVIFKLTKCGLSREGFCILRSVTRIDWLKHTIADRCNRNMYLWWCSNVYKLRLQSFVWRYFYCAFPGSSLEIFDMCSPGWGNLVAFDWNDLPVGREFDGKFLKNVKSPPHALHPPPPPPSAGLTLIGALYNMCKRLILPSFSSTQFPRHSIEA